MESPFRIIRNKYGRFISFLYIQNIIYFYNYNYNYNCIYIIPLYMYVVKTLW